MFLGDTNVISSPSPLKNRLRFGLWFLRFGDMSKQTGVADGYNIGINVGEAAGQTVAHAHLHLIPRFRA